MKRYLLFFFATVACLSAFAELGGNGYYRVQNALTKRYAFLFDNKGRIDDKTTTADVQALQLFSGFLRASSDPSSIFYVESAQNAGQGSYYDIAGQGTSVHGFLNEYVKIIKGKTYDNQQAYYAYVMRSGVAKYLGDRQPDVSIEHGLATADGEKDMRLWYIHPVDASSDDSYFGIAPTLTAGGKYYYPLYADFPYSAYSEGVKFYYVAKVDHRVGIAVLKEVEGTVPAGKAVIVECSTPLATSNRLNVGASGNMADLTDSKLAGVYFDNDVKPTNFHYNRTPYDKQTMRTLGVVDGKLSFVVGNEEFLPRNQAYLQLSDEKQYKVANYTLMSEEEYAEATLSVDVLPVDATVDVYSLDGRLISSGISKADVHSLGKGLYIIRGNGISEKMAVH